MYEFILKCVSESEAQMMKMISKNERLLGRLDEKQLKQKVYMRRCM